MLFMALILGIDPGSRKTGYGIINAVGASRIYVASGHIKISGDELAGRLGQIYRGVDEIIETYVPQEFAICHANTHASLVRLATSRSPKSVEKQVLLQKLKGSRRGRVR
jgi:crossover junction endodeoxyribonuclease RuvC